MLINVALFEIRHHVCQPRLSSRLSTLLLNFIHLLKILLGRRIELTAITIGILCLQGTGLGLGDLIDFKPRAHGRVHHDFTRRLDLLKVIEWNIIQIACTIETSLLIAHHLLEEDISTGLALLFLEQQVVS